MAGPWRATNAVSTRNVKAKNGENRPESRFLRRKDARTAIGSQWRIADSWSAPGPCGGEAASSSASVHSIGSTGATSASASTWSTWLTGMILSRSEEHTSELQSLMRISYAVFCLKKKIEKSSIEYTVPETATGSM